MSQLKVLVVGASIAGPSTAYWLAKAGAKVTIIERFPELRTNGQGIDIRTVGVTVMRRIPGMEAAVRAKSTQLEGMSFVRENGRPYGTLRATGDPDQQSLVSEFEIFRGDLAQILFDLTKDDGNIDYVFGEQVASMRQNVEDTGTVTVEFANGLPASEYDLVVACDGATSRTRAMGFNCGIRDYIKSTNCWAAYFSVARDLLQGSKIGQAHSAVRGRLVAIGPDPSGVNRILMTAVNPLDGRDATLPFRAAMKQGDSTLKRFVAQHFTGVGWKTDELLADMMNADDFYASEILQVKAPKLYNGRFVLVGDAGYAGGFTGTGTSLAMAGAYVLAGEIGRCKGDLAAGLAAYEEQMRPLVRDSHKVPPFITTFMAPQTAWGIWVRNHLFAFVAWTRLLEWVQRVFGGAFASTEKNRLRDYEWVG